VKRPKTKRLHIVEGTDWKTSVIALLDSRSPYRPWRYGFGEARIGDPVAIVLNTEPRTVMTSLGRFGTDGRRDRAVVEWPLPAPSLVDLDSLVMLLELDSDLRDVWKLRGDAARGLEVALADASERRDHRMRFGHSSVAEARVLLHSRGRCSGCKSLIDLAGEEAIDSFRIRTVDAADRAAPDVLIADGWGSPSYLEAGIPASCWREALPEDWPGVLCMSCCRRMDEDGYASLIDFRFSQHARCPRCGAAKTQILQFGMPISREAHLDTPPWVSWRGCVTRGERWACSMCAHTW
jgi:hypothetical protein